MDINKTSALVVALQTAAKSLIEGTPYTWTGATKVRTIAAEETGLDEDLEFLYFQLKDREGELFWQDEAGMDELSDEDMQDR